jgi:hypothetical protein
LKNDGVRQWEGCHPIYEMDNKKCLKPPTHQPDGYIILHISMDLGFLMGYNGYV